MNPTSSPQTERNPIYPILWGVAILGVLLLNIQDFGLTKVICWLGLVTTASCPFTNSTMLFLGYGYFS
jgi:uncharacterized membrane protein YeiB